MRVFLLKRLSSASHWILAPRTMGERDLICEEANSHHDQLHGPVDAQPVCSASTGAGMERGCHVLGMDIGMYLRFGKHFTDPL